MMLYKAIEPVVYFEKQLCLPPLFLFEFQKPKVSVVMDYSVEMCMVVYGNVKQTTEKSQTKGGLTHKDREAYIQEQTKCVLKCREKQT